MRKPELKTVVACNPTVVAPSTDILPNAEIISYRDSLCNKTGKVWEIVWESANLEDVYWCVYSDATVQDSDDFDSIQLWTKSPDGDVFLATWKSTDSQKQFRRIISKQHGKSV